MTAEKAGNKGVDVLSTSMLVQLVESAAIHCIEPALQPGQITFGTHIDLEHTNRFRLASSSGPKSKS